MVRHTNNLHPKHVRFGKVFGALVMTCSMYLACPIKAPLEIKALVSNLRSNLEGSVLWFWLLVMHVYTCSYVYVIVIGSMVD